MTDKVNDITGDSVAVTNNCTADAEAENSALMARGSDYSTSARFGRTKALANISKSAREMKERYDKSRKVATHYKIGDLVLWANAPASKTGVGVGHKLANKFDGVEATKGVRGYKRFQVMVDSLR